MTKNAKNNQIQPLKELIEWDINYTMVELLFSKNGVLNFDIALHCTLTLQISPLLSSDSDSHTQTTRK